MIAGRSPWLCQGTTPPGAMVSLRRRKVRPSIFAGSSARLIAVSTVSVTPLAGVPFGIVASAIILSCGHCPANDAAPGVHATMAIMAAASDLRILTLQIRARDALL